jgi:hypothetical protein
VDADGPDGVLEGFDYSGSYGLLSACKGSTIAYTPEGYDVTVDRYGAYVCMPSGSKFINRKYWTVSRAAVTGSDPTEPFTSNGQEVCGGMGMHDGSGQNDTGDGGSSVPVTIEGQVYGVLHDGDTSVYTLGSVDFEVSVELFNSTSVIFWINGRRSEPLEEGQHYLHQAGIQIRVDDIQYSETEPSTIRFYLGA